MGPTGQDGGGATDREDTGPDSGTGSTQDDTDGRDVPGGSSSRAEVLKKSIKACRGYREDTLSREEKARLLELADGERNLDRFCDRLLGADDGDGRDDGDGQGDGDGKGTDGGSGGGSLPSIVFRDPSAESTRDSRLAGRCPAGRRCPVADGRRHGGIVVRALLRPLVCNALTCANAAAVTFFDRPAQ